MRRNAFIGALYLIRGIFPNAPTLQMIINNSTAERLQLSTICVPHAVHLMEEYQGGIRTLLSVADRLEFVQLLFHIANIMGVKARPIVKMYKEVLQTRVWLLGDENSETVDAMTALVSSYQEQGLLPQASAIRKRALSLSTKLSGEDNRTILMAMLGLSITYFQQAKLEEASALQTDAYKMLQNLFGQDHPQT